MVKYNKYRKRAYKRRGRKQTGWFNTKKFTPESAWSLAKTAAQDIYYLKGLINSEKHYHTQTLTLGSNQSTIWQLNNIAQGDTASTRTGNSILCRSLAFKGYSAINGNVTAHTRLMFALVMDTQQLSDTTPSVGDIFASSTKPETLIRQDTAGRFKILKRWNHVLYTNAAGMNLKNVDHYQNLYFHTRWNGTASTDIQKNGLYLVCITSENVNFPTVSIDARLGYYDN